MPCEHHRGRWERTIRLDGDARSALGQIIGITIDQVWTETTGTDHEWLAVAAQS